MSSRKRTKLSSDPIEVTSESDPWLALDAHLESLARQTLQPDDWTVNRYVREAMQRGQNVSKVTATRRLDKMGMTRVEDVYDPSARRMVIAWRPVPEVLDEDLRHTCGDCGQELQIIRPGKWQCVNGKCKGKRLND